MGILASLFGKSFASRPLPGVLQIEEGFVDIDLPIVSTSKEKSGAVRVAAQGIIEGQLVGLAISLDPVWKHQPLENSNAVFYWGSARWENSGAESDRLVRLLTKQYGLAVNRQPRMLASLSAEAVGLDTDPTQVLSSPAKMKFFFHSNDQERYAEVFVNVDVQGGWLELHEKDPEYRANLVRALTEA